MTTVLEVRGVHKAFAGTKVLRGVDLNIAQGKIRVILGGSGAGKSVLLKHLIGLMHPDAGTVSLQGQDLSQLSGQQLLLARKRMGMVFQHAALFDSMSALDNVAFPLREHTQSSEDDIQAQAMAQLEAVGLAHRKDALPAVLSGGQRKRVGLARALILEPAILFYDEPTTGLDPLTSHSVDAMIVDAGKRSSATSVVISHDIGSALNIADEIAFLHEGKIVADGSAQEVRASTHPFVKNFFQTWFDKQ